MCYHCCFQGQFWGGFEENQGSFGEVLRKIIYVIRGICNLKKRIYAIPKYQRWLIRKDVAGIINMPKIPNRYIIHLCQQCIGENWWGIMTKNIFKTVFNLSLFFYSIWIEGDKLVDMPKLILLQCRNTEILTQSMKSVRSSSKANLAAFWCPHSQFPYL